MAMCKEGGKVNSNHIKTLIFQLMMIMLYINKTFFRPSQLIIKCERQRGRKLKLTGGDSRLAQGFIRPEFFSVHMKGLKIWALLCKTWTALHTALALPSFHCSNRKI
jgi:hypothetical protein